MIEPNKWQLRFLALAKHIASWSKDPSTQVGAVIVDNQRRIVSTGYNGLPQGVSDFHKRYVNRDLKYKMIIHAEMNAIAFAQRSLQGCRLYTWPFAPCAVCTGVIIQSGIVQVVAPEISDELMERWGEDMMFSIQMFEEAGVTRDIIMKEYL